MEQRDIIIDCDTGVDDALALLLALRSPAFNVLGITCASGNVPIDKVVRNTLVVVEHSGKLVPVFQGAYRPLLGAGETAEYAHGQDGLGDVGFPDPKIVKNDEHAVDYIVRTFMESDGSIDMITTGPLTNLALALQKERGLEKRIRSLVMMAGAVDSGNTTPMAEFNVFVDPEAADIVFRSAIPNKTMVGLDPIRKSGIYPEDVERLEKSDSPWCSMAAKLLRVQLRRWEVRLGHPLPTTPPDLVAMAVAIDPCLADAEMLNVTVETGGVYSRGVTVVDRRPYRNVFRQAPEPNINVVWTIDNDAYRDMVLSTWLSK